MKPSTLQAIKTIIAHDETLCDDERRALLDCLTAPAALGPREQLAGMFYAAMIIRPTPVKTPVRDRNWELHVMRTAIKRADSMLAMLDQAANPREVQEACEYIKVVQTPGSTPQI